MKSIRKCGLLAAIGCAAMVFVGVAPALASETADPFQPAPSPDSVQSAPFQQELDRSSAQVEIEVSWVAFGTAEIENLIKRDSSVTAEALMQLWKRDKGKLVGFGKVTTQPGEEATVKSVSEYIYPTDPFLSTNSSARWSGSLIMQQTIMMPGAFETREVGVTVTAKPEISQNRAEIAVLLSPDMVREPVWHKYQVVPISDGVRNAALPNIEWPFFVRDTATTTVRVRDGKTVIAGGSNKMPGGDVVFILLTVNLVGLDGKPPAKAAEKGP